MYLTFTINSLVKLIRRLRFLTKPPNTAQLSVMPLQ